MRKLAGLSLIAGAALAALPAAAPAASGAFQSPSGNMGCYISAGGARCDIAVHSWPTPAEPASCDLDYGGGLAVGKKGRGGFFCAGDTTLHQGPVLAYGTARSAGRFTCQSRTAGMRCVNRRNGHGFLLARDSFRRF
ncbi:MAG: hypothetical protein JWM73_409 [Solirubrobacterales bacterium]|nr:hypothetical protein [Solirubrobacterales bacterium]